MILILLGVIAFLLFLLVLGNDVACEVLIRLVLLTFWLTVIALEVWGLFVWWR